MRKIGHVGDCHLFSTCSFQKSWIVQLFWGIASFDACQYCLTQLFTNLGQLFESHTIVTNIYMLFTKARVWRSWIYATLRIMSLSYRTCMQYENMAWCILMNDIVNFMNGLLLSIARLWRTCREGKHPLKFKCLFWSLPIEQFPKQENTKTLPPP